MDNITKTEVTSQPASNFELSQKLKTAISLYWSAKHLKASYYRQQHPECSEIKIQQMVKEWMLYGNPLNAVR